MREANWCGAAQTMSRRIAKVCARWAELRLRRPSRIAALAPKVPASMVMPAVSATAIATRSSGSRGVLFRSGSAYWHQTVHADVGAGQSDGLHGNPEFRYRGEHPRDLVQPSRTVPGCVGGRTVVTCTGSARERRCRATYTVRRAGIIASQFKSVPPHVNCPVPVSSLAQGLQLQPGDQEALHGGKKRQSLLA
eukprot:scaffold10253_cov124-Isochrysis_galbana.AAC.25